MDKEKPTNEWVVRFLRFMDFLTNTLFLVGAMWITFVGTVIIWKVFSDPFIVVIWISWVVPVSIVARGWVKYYWLHVLADEMGEKAEEK